MAAWDQLNKYLQTQDPRQLNASLDAMRESSAWIVLCKLLELKAEESRFNLHANVVDGTRLQAAACESGKELTFRYIADQVIDDLQKIVTNTSPVTEEKMPEEAYVEE